MKDRRFLSRLLAALLAACCPAARTARAAEDATVRLDDQWYTGSLLSPSGALAKQGMVSVEPYLIFADQTGNFGATGRSSPLNAASRSLTSLTLFKYGVTDHLSLQLLPTVSYGWSRRDTTSGIRPNDLPVELQYRILDVDELRLRPAVTVFLGLQIPLGDFDRLTRLQDGVGNGAWSLRFGLLGQSAYPVAGRPLRVRIYADARQPLATVGVRGASVYGTYAGFEGQASPGISATFGTSVEYGLTQAWVFALDAVRDYADGFRLRGQDPDGSRIGRSQGASTDWTLAPAVEYSVSGNVGVIAGASVTLAGHNTRRLVSPQIAVDCVF